MNKYLAISLVHLLSYHLLIDRESISSDKCYLTHEICWSIVKSMDADRSYRCKAFIGRSGSQWVLIRATDHKTFVGRSGSKWALIRATDH